MAQSENGPIDPNTMTPEARKAVEFFLNQQAETSGEPIEQTPRHAETSEVDFSRRSRAIRLAYSGVALTGALALTGLLAPGTIRNTLNTNEHSTATPNDALEANLPVVTHPNGKIKGFKLKAKHHQEHRKHKSPKQVARAISPPPYQNAPAPVVAPVTQQAANRHSAKIKHGTQPSTIKPRIVDMNPANTGGAIASQPDKPQASSQQTGGASFGNTPVTAQGGEVPYVSNGL